MRENKQIRARLDVEMTQKDMPWYSGGKLETDRQLWLAGADV